MHKFPIKMSCGRCSQDGKGWRDACGRTQSDPMNRVLSSTIARSKYGWREDEENLSGKLMQIVLAITALESVDRAEDK
jgi:hypothetical protein